MTERGVIRRFETTPSWVIGAVVFVIVTISCAIDNLLNYLGHVLKKNHKKPLYDALQTIKEELMLMGFVSLLIALVQDRTMEMCIPRQFYLNFLPCHTTSTTHGRHGGPSFCKKGKVPLLTLEVLHELHYLIFILAVAHAINCTITVLLGEAKISRWQKWEDSLRNNVNVDPTQSYSFTIIEERSVSVDAKKRHYVYSFFKYLGEVVTQADYKAIRAGFITKHCKGNRRFNFHKYMVYRTKLISRKSWFLWVIAVISLSLNIAGWNVYFWLSFIPLLLLLVVGTKLEKVITDLATDVIKRPHPVILEEIRLRPSDEYFWFKNPRILLFAIHAILFMNSFSFAIFIWTLLKFKQSCIMGNPKFAIARIGIILVVQFFCSFSSLPLYAIVTQMGSSVNQEGMSEYMATASLRSSGIIPEDASDGANADADADAAATTEIQMTVIK